MGLSRASITVVSAVLVCGCCDTKARHFSMCSTSIEITYSLCSDYFWHDENKGTVV